MTHRIEAGQEYTFCAAHPCHFRIRVLSGATPGGRVKIATIADDGRLLRLRLVNARDLHAEPTTRNGQPRRTGYALVKQDGSSER